MSVGHSDHSQNPLTVPEVVGVPGSLSVSTWLCWISQLTQYAILLGPQSSPIKPPRHWWWTLQVLFITQVVKMSELSRVELSTPQPLMHSKSLITVKKLLGCWFSSGEIKCSKHHYFPLRKCLLHLNTQGTDLEIHSFDSNITKSVLPRLYLGKGYSKRQHHWLYSIWKCSHKCQFQLSSTSKGSWHQWSEMNVLIYYIVVLYLLYTTSIQCWSI